VPSSQPPRKRQRLSRSAKRPATPVTSFSVGTQKHSVREKIKQAGGVLRQLLPERWRSTTASSSSSSVATTSVTATASTAPLPSSSFRPTYLSIEREAAAAAANVDILTYNLMMDLQTREITPEDYDTLRRLDSSVAPRTLAISELDKHAPSWQVPASVNAPLASSRLCMITRRSSAAAAAAAAVTTDGPEPNFSSQNLAELSCCICLETFTAGNRVRRLPCRHLFHASCEPATPTDLREMLDTPLQP